MERVVNEEKRKKFMEYAEKKVFSFATTVTEEAESTVEEEINEETIKGETI